MTLYYNTTMFDNTPRDITDEEFADRRSLRTRSDRNEYNDEPRGSFFGDLLRFSILSVAIVIPIRLFIASPFIVNGASMDPTFHTGEYLIIDQVSYRFSEPERGDVVVFHYPKDPSKFFIKRVIGLPGEIVAFEGEAIRIKKNEEDPGFILNQSFLENSSVDAIEVFTLRDDEYIVLGDNRRASSDSRAWGTVNEKLIVGRALLRLFPLKTAEFLPGDVSAEQLEN